MYLPVASLRVRSYLTVSRLNGKDPRPSSLSGSQIIRGNYNDIQVSVQFLSNGNAKMTFPARAQHMNYESRELKNLTGVSR